MRLQITDIVDRAAAGRDRFPVEAKFVLGQLGLAAAPGNRLMEDLLVLYRRYDSALGVMERAFRPPAALLLADWLAAVLRNGETVAPAYALHGRGLIHLAAAGLETECLADLARAWADRPGFREPDATFFRASLSQVRRYIRYLRDFDPYLGHSDFALARRLCLTHHSDAGEEVIAAYISLGVAETLYLNDRENVISPYWLNDRTKDYLFPVFADHYLRRADLPEDYLDTPFREVMRNVPNIVWADIPDPDVHQPVPWPFTLGEPGFYHLAAGKSARQFLREAGLSRAMWRTFVKHEMTTLSRKRRPCLFVWAVSLGGNWELAEELMSFIPAGAEKRWARAVGQLARMDVQWASGEGQRLLGYVYHMLRDQPGFRVRAGRTAALLAAANAHYAQIRQRQEAIHQQRLAEKAAWDALASGAQDELVRNYSRRHHAERSWLQSRKWERSARIRPYAIRNRGVRIVELTNSWELLLEGERMQHCVGDYTRACMDGAFSIWSLRFHDKGVVRSIVTVEVDNRGLRIVQARARFNRIPDQCYQKIILDWARENDIRPPAGWA